MPAPRNHHDALFRKVFGEVDHARAELRAVLPPALLAKIDLSTLRPQSESFVDASLAGSQSDLLYSVSIMGQPALLYLLFEHLSTGDELIPLRLLKYSTRIWDRHLATAEKALPLPLVVAVVLHHSENGWTAARTLQELFDPTIASDRALSDFVPRFRFVLDDISRLSDRALWARALGHLPTLALWALRDARNPANLLRSYASFLEPMRALARAENGLEALRVIFRYLSLVAERSVTEVIYTTITTTIEQTEEALGTLAEHWLAEGEAKGFAKGEAKAVLAVLDARKLTVTHEQRQRILDCSDLAALDRWVRQAVTVTEVSQLFE